MASVLVIGLGGAVVTDTLAADKTTGGTLQFVEKSFEFLVS